MTGILGFAIAAISIVFFYFFVVRVVDRAGQPDLSDTSKPYMQVGEETIYIQDLTTELDAHPQRTDPQVRAMLIDKLINDSVTLQKAAEEKIIELTPNVFNAINKDYSQRIELVSYVQQVKNADPTVITGSVIAVWFYNNDYVGPGGLEASKQIAFEKISAVRKRVVLGELTMLDAGRVLAEDTSLSEIDLAWQNNAYFSFSARADDKITIDPAFDQMIRSLEPGEVSSVYLAKNQDIDPSKRVDALYYVAKVTSKTAHPASARFKSYDEWLLFVKDAYDVTYY